MLAKFHVQSVLKTTLWGHPTKRAVTPGQLPEIRQEHVSALNPRATLTLDTVVLDTHLAPQPPPSPDEIVKQKDRPQLIVLGVP